MRKNISVDGLCSMHCKGKRIVTYQEILPLKWLRARGLSEELVIMTDRNNTRIKQPAGSSLPTQDFLASSLTHSWLLQVISVQSSDCTERRASTYACVKIIQAYFDCHSRMLRGNNSECVQDRLKHEGIYAFQTNFQLWVMQPDQQCQKVFSLSRAFPWDMTVCWFPLLPAFSF